MVTTKAIPRPIAKLIDCRFLRIFWDFRTLRKWMKLFADSKLIRHMAGEIYEVL